MRRRPRCSGFRKGWPLEYCYVTLSCGRLVSSASTWKNRAGNRTRRSVGALPSHSGARLVVPCPDGGDRVLGYSPVTSRTGQQTSRTCCLSTRPVVPYNTTQQPTAPKRRRQLSVQDVRPWYRLGIRDEHSVRMVGKSDREGGRSSGGSIPILSFTAPRIRCLQQTQPRGQ